MKVANNLPDSISTSRKFAKNAFLNIAGFMVTFPILILLTPYMLEVLGKARFGVWALAGVMTSYAQLSDMGMTAALVKFVAEHWAKRDMERISGIVSTAFFSFALIGGLVAGGMLLLRHFIVVSLLKVPQQLQPEALFVVTGVVVIFYFNLLFSVYNAVLLGLQRMDVTNGILVVSKVLRAGGMYFFLASGFGLKGLIINGAIFSALTILANVFWAKRLTVALKVNPFWVSFFELRGIVKYSVNIFLARLMGLAQDPINKIILAAYTSLPFVSFYEVGCRVMTMVRQLFHTALSPLFPASSELHSVSNTQELERIYLSVSRILYLLAVPVFSLLIVVAEPLVQLWLGDGYKMAARAIQFLLLGNLFSLLVSPQYIIFLGIGKPQLSTLISGLTSVLNVMICVGLGKVIGYYGVLIGISFSLIATSICLVFLFAKVTESSIANYWTVLPAKGMALSLVISVVLRILIQKVPYPNIFVLGVLICGSALSYFLLGLLLGVFNREDKQMVLKLRKSFALATK